MTNLELANTVIENSNIAFELTYNMEKISDSYLEEMTDKVENEWIGYLENEEVELSEVDNFNDYIIHNIKAQIENEVNVNEHYETISINVLIK